MIYEFEIIEELNAEIEELRFKLKNLLSSWEEESKINRKMAKIVNIDFEKGSKYRLKRCIKELKKVIDNDSSKM